MNGSDDDRKCPCLRRRILPRALRCLVSRLTLRPPPLPRTFRTDQFYRFMRAEVACFSRRYARHRVHIENPEVLRGLDGGAVLAFVHYGSFFLSGGAIHHQLGHCYTAMVSRRNLIPAVMSERDIDYWRWVHGVASGLYCAPVLFSDQPAREAVRWLRAGNLLGMALDVREHGQRHKETALRFLGEEVFMQTGPARLAHGARVPLVPMSIRYQRERRRHLLRFGDPVSGEPRQATQTLLEFLQQDPAQAPEQLFHDIVATFRQPAPDAIVVSDNP